MAYKYNSYAISWPWILVEIPLEMFQLYVKKVQHHIFVQDAGEVLHLILHLVLHLAYKFRRGLGCR